MALKFQPPQNLDTTSPNEAFNKGLGNSISNLPLLYQQTKMAKMKQDLELKMLDRQLKGDEFDRAYKTEDLGLKKDANALANRREDRTAQYQADMLDIRERLAALAEKMGETKQTMAEQKMTKEAEKQEGLKTAAVKQADRVIGKVDQALEKTSGWSTGWGAFFLGKVPKSDAKALAADLKTIKANLGFAELQEMRRNSPTGGALGQVAVQELDMLQSTVENLDQELSDEDLAKNLKAIKTHYENWKKAVEGADEGGETGGSELSGEDAQALEWANSNPDDPRATAIKTRLGR